MADKKILIVDDEPDVVEIIQDCLTQDGFSFERAYNGKSALERLQEGSYDLIISDYNMPEVDGLELLKQAREKGILTPIIWLTGRADRELFRKAWNLGVYDFFDKPFDLVTLKESVSGALSLDGSYQPEGRKAKLESIATEIPADLSNDLAKRAAAANMTVEQFLADLLKKEFKK